MVVHVVARSEVVVLQHRRQRIETLDGRIGTGLKTVALIDLVYREPGLHVLLRFVVENVFATVRAAVVLHPLVFTLAPAGARRVVGLAEHERNLTDLAQHGQGLVVEALARRLLVAEVLEARPIVLVEGIGVLL